MSFMKNLAAASPPKETRIIITTAIAHCTHIAFLGISPSILPILPGHNSAGVPSIICFKGA